MKTQFYNKGYINTLTCKLHEELSIHIDMLTASDIWANSVYYSKVDSECEFSFFILCCKDGNLEISNFNHYNKKQLFCLEVIKEKMLYRQLSEDVILEFINSIK